MLRRGLEADAELAALREIAARANGEPDADEPAAEDEVAADSERPAPVTPEQLRATALKMIASRYESSLDHLEGWLGGEVHPDRMIELISIWALPAADLDLVRVRHEARLYIDAYPFEGRVIGNVPERCARWLAQRTAMFVTPAEHLPAVRRAIVTLADAAEPRHPATALSLRAAAAQVTDDDLWYGLSLEISETEMQKVNRGKRR
ncbi:MAG TPA: hypothetical protein VGM91_18250 [Conexibacter sp.]